MSNWTLFFNFPICKVRGKTVSGGYYTASSPILKTKPEIRTVSCLMWFVTQEVLQGHHTKNISPVTVTIPRSPKCISYVGFSLTESPWLTVILSRTHVLMRKSLSDSVIVETHKPNQWTIKLHRLLICTQWKGK